MGEDGGAVIFVMFVPVLSLSKLCPKVPGSLLHVVKDVHSSVSSYFPVQKQTRPVFLSSHHEPRTPWCVETVIPPFPRIHDIHVFTKLTMMSNLVLNFTRLRAVLFLFSFSSSSSPTSPRHPPALHRSGQRRASTASFFASSPSQNVPDLNRDLSIGAGSAGPRLPKRMPDMPDKMLEKYSVQKSAGKDAR